MLACPLYGFVSRNLDWVVSWVPAHPFSSAFRPVNPELQCASTSDTSEAGRELVVILEFQPIGEARAIAVIMQRCEESFTIRATQYLRSEASTEQLIVLS